MTPRTPRTTHSPRKARPASASGKPSHRTTDESQGALRILLSAGSERVVVCDRDDGGADGLEIGVSKGFLTRLSEVLPVNQTWLVGAQGG
jgi:hypothetical protein